MLERVENQIRRADAVVLMQFVRTGMGQHVRKLASEHGKPWIPCTGHGLSALQRSITEAILVAARIQASKETR